MLSVLIPARPGEEERLARTLASLVPAAVEGVVREVIVVCADGDAAVTAVADHAGCRAAPTLPAAIEAARGPWLLVLEPGARLLEGWGEVALAHAAEAAGAARFSPDASAPLARRLLPMRGRPLSRGLLIRRQDAAALAGRNENFARGLRPRKLSARIVPAE